MSKLLIVDDSKFMRTILKDLVLQSNWKDSQILEAGDGEEGLSIFNSEKPELVLMDIVMPKKNGMEVLSEIGRSAKAVVLITSVGQESVINEARNLGAKDYIVKPFDSKKVIETLNTLHVSS